MNKTSVTLLIIAAVLLSACNVSVQGPSVTILRGSGKVATESRNVSGFNSLSMAGLGDITVTQGQTESLTIEAEDNILPHIKTEVRNGALTISFDRDGWQDAILPSKPVRFNLAVKDLSSVTSSGLGNITAVSLKTNKLTIKVTGAGNVKIDRLDTAEVSSSITGAGNIDLAGQVARQEITSEGAGNYRAADLNSQQAKITVKGAGSVTIWVRDSLDVTIAGLGSVNYYGNPAVTKNITGLGVFKSMGNK
jgi:hypothetical protein